MSLLIHACTKDEEVFDSENNHTALQFRNESKTIFSPSDTIKETILGSKLPCNPYTVDIVTQAWNNLYPNNTYTQLPLSHKYVKFSPTNGQEVYDLYNDNNIVVWDYPLDHEVIQMGDYYKQPNKGKNEIPDLYSVVDKDYPLATKGVNYTELEQLIKVPYNTMLSAESYRLCDIKHIVIHPPSDPPPHDPPPHDPPPPDPIDNCSPDCPNYPCCFLDIVECDNELEPFEQAICDMYVPLCFPDDPNWPECLEPKVDDSNSRLNDCGCPRYTNTRKPAGCVNVQDPTGSGYTGVNNAKIIIKNTPCYDCPDGSYVFFSLWTETTNTNEHGCWKINIECRGKIYMWVQFKNEDAYIRSPNFSVYTSGTDTYTGLPEIGIDGNILNYIKPVKDNVGGISGPNFSNIQVNYSRWTTEGTQTQRYWCAAQTINAVADMHDMCSQESINVPDHLDIYLGSGGGGAAPMSHYGGAAVAALCLAQLNGIILLQFMPDVYLGKDRAPRRYRFLNFHEMAHASHFTNVGIGWWNKNVNYQIGQILSNPDNDPYGDGTATNAGYCGIAESWGEHVGVLFDGGDVERLDWEANGWIPEGIHNDLFDLGIGAEPVTGIIDNVSGFTNAMIFDILDENTTTIEQMRTRLWNEYSTASGVNTTEADYLLLFNEYGY